MNSYYTHYIVIGGACDGKLYPRTPDGLHEAMQAGGDCIRPARQVSERSAEDWNDWNDYGCAIDRGNSAAYAKP